jgi:methionyl-tRNA formyltransferase
MKIVLFLNKDLESNWAFNLLKDELEEHTVRIYYSETVGNPSGKPADLLNLEYYEKDFVYKDIARFLEGKKLESGFELFDDQFDSFPFERCDQVNSVEFIDAMRDFEADLFISIRFGKIFRDEIIQIPKQGLLNLHSAILPDYKGIMGTLHALKDHKKEIGCTLHTIPDAGIDTGEIISVARVNVEIQRSLFWHIMQLYPKGVDLLVRAIRLLASGESLLAQVQSPEEGRYFSVPSEEDFKVLNANGFDVFSTSDYKEIISQLFFCESNPDDLEELFAKLEGD